MTTIDVYAAITKREKDPVTGFWTVYGKATGPDLDLDEQRMDPDWLAKAVPDWFETGANVREMHKASAVGKGTDLTKDGDDYWLKTLVVDAEACNKVEHEVYTGYSITVRNPRIIKDASAPNGRIVGGMIPEISLVDRPCLPSAKFLTCKALGGAPGELEPISIDGYLLIKDAGEMDTAGSVETDPTEADEVDLIAIARDALSQWLAQEASEVAEGTGGRLVVRLICDVLADLDWAEEADMYDDAEAAMAAVKALLTTPAQEAEDVNLNKLATLTKAATAADASDDDKAAVAELRKALGIDDLDTKITAEVTKATRQRRGPREGRAPARKGRDHGDDKRTHPGPDPHGHCTGVRPHER
jgi:hypothetical protein